MCSAKRKQRTCDMDEYGCRISPDPYLYHFFLKQIYLFFNFFLVYFILYYIFVKEIFSKITLFPYIGLIRRASLDRALLEKRIRDGWTATIRSRQRSASHNGRTRFNIMYFVQNKINDKQNKCILFIYYDFNNELDKIHFSRIRNINTTATHGLTNKI